MGFIYHTAIVVTSWEENHIAKAHEIASDLGLRPTGICGPYTNGYMSFLIPPDGSKEGWSTSDEFDTLRDDWERGVSGLYLDWVRVMYGEAGPEVTSGHHIHEDESA